MARMRAQSYVKTYGTNVLNMAPTNGFATHILAPGAFPRQLKNIRGEFQFTTSDTTPTGADAAAGWVGLLRWPSTDTPSQQEVLLGDSRLLHPVVWHFRNYPGHVHYEFKGINLSTRDTLYLVVHKGLHTGSDSVYVDFVLLWAQLNHPVVAT